MPKSKKFVTCKILSLIYSFALAIFTQTILRRRGREAEGDGLLNRYTGDCIGGSNPLVSANFLLLTCSPLHFSDFLLPPPSPTVAASHDILIFNLAEPSCLQKFKICQNWGYFFSVSPDMLHFFKKGSHSKLLAWQVFHRTSQSG